MTATDPDQVTASAMLAAFAAGDTSPLEVLERTIERINDRDGSIGAVLEVLPTARASADESGRRWRAGEPRLLEGVPFGIKDNIQVEGLRASFGSTPFAGHVAGTTAAVVQRLQDAGAVLTARLATYEFAAGPTDDTANPWDLTRRSGGSSSGPAAALASRLLPLALGTDTGGSIRVPAAWCGVTGLKPTYGLVPSDGVAPLSWSLDHIGPLALTAQDIGAVLAVLTDQVITPPFGGTNLNGLTLGRPSTWFFENCDEDVMSAVERALDVLTSAGASVRDVDIPAMHLIDADLIKHILVGAEAASFHGELHDRWDEYTPGLHELLTFGTSLSATDYVRAQRLRKPLFDAVQNALAEVDALIMPTSGIAAPRRDADTVRVDGVEQPVGEVVARNTSVFNITGHPALTVPCGCTRDALPVGLQIVAAPWHEAMCLAVGQALQRLTDHHVKAPTIASLPAQ